MLESVVYVLLAVVVLGGGFLLFLAHRNHESIKQALADVEQRVTALLHASHNAMIATVNAAASPTPPPVVAPPRLIPLPDQTALRLPWAVGLSDAEVKTIGNARISTAIHQVYDPSKVDMASLSAMNLQNMKAGHVTDLDFATGLTSGDPDPSTAIQAKALKGIQLTDTDLAFMAYIAGDKTFSWTNTADGSGQFSR